MAEKTERQQAAEQKASWLTLLAALSGVALIVAFFLPIVRFDERTTEALDASWVTFKRAYGDWLSAVNAEPKKLEQPVREATSIRAFGDLLAERDISTGDLKRLHAFLESYFDFVNYPSGYNACVAISRASPEDHGESEDQRSPLTLVRVPFSEEVLGRASVARTLWWIAVSLPAFGALHLFLCFIRQFRPYKASFLVLAFIPGFVYLAFVGVSLFAQFWTQQGSEAAHDEARPRETRTVEVDEELPDRKAAIRAFESVRLDVGTHLAAGAGAGLLVVALFGARSLGEHWYRVYFVYGIVVALVVFGFMRMHAALAPPSPENLPPAAAVPGEHSPGDALRSG